jgi:hypothetical protein
LVISILSVAGVIAPPSSVDLMRGARKDKELLLDALERIDHHTHGA